MNRFLDRVQRAVGEGGGGAGENGAEAELIDAVRRGDAEAFELLLNRHQERVLRLVLSILKDPMDTEEVVQDVFVRVLDKIDSFRGDSSFSTWIHRIAVNAALMRKRQHRAGAEVPLDEVMPEFDEQGQIAGPVVDGSEQAADPVLREEGRQLIQAAVDRLDSKYQTVFLLRDVEGFSTEETANILGLGIPAVKSRLHRARLYLRKELAGYYAN